MATRYEDITTAIVSVITGIDTTAAGTSYAYERYVRTWPDFKTLFLDSAGVVHGWWLILQGRAPWVDGSAFGVDTSRYRFQARGVYALGGDESTERSFLATVDSILDALNNRRDLSMASVIDYGISAELVTAEKRFFGDVLATYVEIDIEVDAKRTVSYS